MATKVLLKMRSHIAYMVISKMMRVNSCPKKIILEYPHPGSLKNKGDPSKLARSTGGTPNNLIIAPLSLINFEASETTPSM